MFNTLKTFSRTLPNFLCLFQRSFRSIRSPVRPPRPSQVGFFNRKLSTRQKVIFWTNKLATGLPPATAKSSLYTATLSRQQRECCANIQLKLKLKLKLKLPAKIENSKQTNLSLSSCSANSFVFLLYAVILYMITSLHSPWARPPRGRPRWPPPAARTF